MDTKTRFEEEAKGNSEMAYWIYSHVKKHRSVELHL